MKRIVFEVQDTEEFFGKLKELFLPEIRALFRDEFAKTNNENDEDLLTPKQGMDWLYSICKKGSLSSWANFRLEFPELFIPHKKGESTKNHYLRSAFKEAAKRKGWME